MSTSTLVKPLLHNSVADSVFKEITSRTGRYYYFLGTVIDWVDPANPPLPVDSVEYERDVRRNIVIVKEILPGDVAYVVNRIDWVANAVYDMYDDAYSNQLVGVNLISGGTNYSANANVTISGGGGAGATAVALVSNGSVSSIVVTNKGDGYITAPNVVISDAFGIGAVAQGKLNFAASGAFKLQDSRFYVVTDDFNIYKCLDNNNNANSIIKPVDVAPEPFLTADGYKWKYLGSVPIALRNKFLTPTQVPITTALTDQFYSAGEIRNVGVFNTGNNYTYASIVVQGDGYLPDEPYLVVNYVIPATAVGNPYTYANVIIDPPILSSTLWTPSNTFTAGQFIRFENNYYQVIRGGQTDTFGPVHTQGMADNGTTILKFKGTGITANAVISSGNIIGLSNLVGMVRDIVITNNGSGYNSTPSITISGGSGSNAAATATLIGNSLLRISILNSGKGYTTAPTITIGTSWTQNTTYTVNSQVYNGPRLYTVSTGGTSNTTAPSHSSGTQVLGTAAFTFVGTAATAYARLKYGSGYLRTPNVTITGDGSNAAVIFQSEKTEAEIYPYIEDGKITNVNIEKGGIGYTNATLTVIGDGTTNADIRASFTTGDLDSLQSSSELLTVSGAIHAIQVTSGGYGYTTANVSISGNGSGATANATIINGRVAKINVITEGSGYTSANVTITGTGAGAQGRVIFAPYGGHGKDIISELYARSLAFYTTINQEKNQGFIVTNDYRQFGIIKEIREYNGSKYFSGLTGSGCWLLSGTVNTSLFDEDVVATRTTDGARFAIVSTSPTGLLAISLDDRVPAVGNSLQVSTGNSFIITGVVKPDVDKYSGELLYVDNRLAFSTTEDQAVSLKTVFKY